MPQLHTKNDWANVAFTMFAIIIFTPQYLHVCNVFARSKFVQIHFFCPVLDFADGWKTAINCHEFAAK